MAAASEIKLFGKWSFDEVEVRASERFERADSGPWRSGMPPPRRQGQDQSLQGAVQDSWCPCHCKTGLLAAPGLRRTHAARQGVRSGCRGSQV